MNRAIGLLLAGAAAYGVYRYSKMSPQQKSALKQRGKDFLDKNLSGVKNMFNKKAAPANGHS